MGKNNACIPNIQPLLAAGIDPKTGLPIKMVDACSCEFMDSIKRNLRIKDQTTALNRYKWYNLPSGITGQLLEKILYYRGQGAFFYLEQLNKFYFLPFTLKAPENSTGLDVYGRYTGISPMTFNGGTTDGKKDRAFIPGLSLNVQYEVILPDEWTEDIATKSAVILNDYTPQISQTILSRQSLNDSVINMMSEALPMARTSLLAGSGIRGMRVSTQDEYSNVKAASKSIQRAAVEGDPWIPYVGTVEFQDLTNGSGTMPTESFLLYMQSLDNFRLSLYGIGTGGLFQKKDHMLQSEADMNSNNDAFAYQDGLTLRQIFCDIVNSIWGLGIWCEPSETVVGDRTLDGAALDENDQSGSMEGEQPQDIGGDENV